MIGKIIINMKKRNSFGTKEDPCGAPLFTACDSKGKAIHNNRNASTEEKRHIFTYISFIFSNNLLV